jgi:hypothetical protein
MKTICLEIRDSMTCIPALAIRMLADNEVQAYYIHRRSGYPADGGSIMLMKLSDGTATNDPYEWPAKSGGARTMAVAHDFVIKNFNYLRDGDVVDVEYILRMTPEPKASERYVEQL